MKKLMLLILVLLAVISLCSCEAPSHRKLQFDTGESYCFLGSPGIYDEYIAIGGSSIFTDYRREYISINDRAYTITNCDCENINT